LYVFPLEPKYCYWHFNLFKDKNFWDDLLRGLRKELGIGTAQEILEEAFLEK
jgi:hypothetical protein